MKFSETDPKLINLLQRRKLSKGRIKQYNTTFTELHEITEKTPSQILKIAKDEQQPFTDKHGNPRILEMDDRTIYSYQYVYDRYLSKKGNGERTKDEKLKTFRSFLKEYNIDLPHPIKYDTKTERTREEDLPTWDNVKKSLKYCKSLRDKTIVLFIATSGMRESDVVNLSIEDLIKAIKIYEINTVEEFYKNEEDIIPCWDFIPQKTSKDGNICITYNTHECIDYLKKYLEDRVNNNYSVELDDPLFRSKKTGDYLNTDSIDKLFQKLNKSLKLGKDKNGIYGKFRPQNLRKLFSTTCRKNITNVIVNKDKTTEIDIVSVFTGHTPPNMNNSDVYDAVSSDSFDNYLRVTYTALLPFLSVGKVKIHQITDEGTKKIKKLEKENKELKEKQSKNDERIDKLEKLFGKVDPDKLEELLKK